MALSIIGAGLGRTGTMSMKLALERLGFGPCFHMTELLADLDRLPRWLRAAEGDPDWDAVFDGFGAAVDYPACTFWAELAERYPDAKVLLTVRDPHAWFESVRETIFSPPMRARVAGTPLERLFDKAVWHRFGERIDDRAHMTAEFERHAAEVRRKIPEDRLLVYEVGAGWGPLCEFLGVGVPAEPFPHTNTREEMRRMVAELEAAAADGQDLDAVGRQVRERLGETGSSQ